MARLRETSRDGRTPKKVCSQGNPERYVGCPTYCALPMSPGQESERLHKWWDKSFMMFTSSQFRFIPGFFCGWTPPRFVRSQVTPEKGSKGKPQGVERGFAEFRRWVEMDTKSNTAYFSPMWAKFGINLGFQREPCGSSQGNLC